MEHEPSKRFRGYRPPGRRWEIFRRQSAVAVLCVFVAMASFYLVRGLMVGEVPLFENDGFQRVVTWEAEPTRFIRYWIGWLIVDVLSVIGIGALRARIRDIRNP